MIRRARATDWAHARALLGEADELHARLAPSYFRKGARAEADWRKLVAAFDAGVFVSEGEPGVGLVGVAIVRVYDTPPDPTMVALRRAHVETLVVSAPRRRRGLGAQLMDEVVAWARRQGAAELVLTVWAGNDAAQAFYERLGYRELSRVLAAKL
ncbi:MAG TPA: GNAT family N-acetyltransferase [Polyangia bacterium]|jgi:ribosomal protein S18 acetylase RimI-like enzyme|nr:GNAT family N-acetyltransferase [Polyangia bacterium]